MFSRRVLLFFSCLWILLGSASFLYAEIAAPPMGLLDMAQARLNLDVTSTSPDYTSIALSAPPIVADQQLFNFESYTVYSLPGEPFVLEEGYPSIPQVPRLYRIPNTGSVDLVLHNTEDFELIEDVDVMPLQFEGSEHFGLARAPVYDQDAWYPPTVAEMSEPMIMRDFRVVRVVLYPVQVNPVTRQVRIYHNLQAEIIANNLPGTNELAAGHRVTGSWAPIYRDVISNLDESALDDATTRPGTYLIMCKQNVEPRRWADSMYVWKKRKGFDVIVDSTHTASANAMITYIRQIYQQNAGTDSSLEFVCLIGDPDWNFGVATDGSNYDHSFALGNTQDDLEDIGVGRLSGNGTTLPTIWAKHAGYERNPWIENSQGQADTMWFHRGFFYAGTQSIASNLSCLRWGAQQFRNWTDVDCTYVHEFGSHWNLATAQAHLALGVSFFLVRPSFVGQVDCLDGAAATWRLPVSFVYTCNANDFAGGTGFAECWASAGTPTQPKGAVVSIGTATSGTHAPQNITVTGGTMYNMANLGVEHYGHCINGAKVWLTLLWGPGHTNAINFSRWNNLMGDPGLSMWTAVPRVMNVAHPTTINVGARRMALTVTDASTGLPVDDALVVMWKGTETYERALTNAQGQVEMPLTINTDGTVMITVTKRNHKPYLANVTCAPAEQMVSLLSYTVDDDNSGGSQGNGDGNFNPTETIDLPVTLKNFGTSTTATNVSAVLTSSNPRITILSASSNFADLAPGATVVSATPYRVQVSPAMQHGETALLTLTITASSIQTQSAVMIECNSPRPDYDSHLFTGQVMPGSTNPLRVTLRNNGQMPLTGTTGQLTSLSPFVQVDDGSGTFGNIAAGATGNNAADLFTISSNSLTFPGHQAPMRLIVNTTNGFVDTTQFVVSIGSAAPTDPTGPDAYGYYAYDNTDNDYELVPTFQYVDISTIGQNLNISDPGDPNSPAPILSAVRRLPFPFTFYGQTYDTITICSNGWIGFGNQGQLDMFRNYPLPAMLAPNAMLAPFWDDLRTNGSGMGVWKYDDLDNHRCIIQWKAGIYTSGPSVDFEVILYDEEWDPTFDGNGKILFQYQNIVMGTTGDFDEPSGCTIGIQDQRGTTALQYAFLNAYTPGSAIVVNNRAILFTTAARMLMGAVSGTVQDAETNQPVPDVNITIDGYSYHTTTNAQGEYLIDDVLIGNYTVRAHRRQYNDATLADVVVALDSTSVVNFSMLHPELALSMDTLDVYIENTGLDTTFSIENGGNGPLDYQILITYAGDGSADPWDSLGSVNITTATNDYLVQGCEFVGDHWVISGAGGGGQPQLHRFTTHGDYAGSLALPASGIGWFDMAYDGQYLFGSEQRTAGGLITGIDPVSGQVQMTLPSPLNPTRAIAYDPSGAGHFWIADYSSSLYKLTRQGTIAEEVSNPSLLITGLAWWDGEPDGFKLLLFCANGSGTQLWKMHPVSHDFVFVTNLAAGQGEHSGGLAITPGWNSTLLVLGGILQGTGGDRLGIYEVTFNTTWISVSPMQHNALPGGSTQTVAVTFDPSFLRTDIYRVDLNIHSNVLDTTYVLPVVLDVVTGAGDREQPEMPQTFALHQNYPNPFNPTTEIRFDLPAAGRVNLAIYNTLGQKIRTLSDGMFAAGSHRLSWDGRNDQGASVAAGLFIYRLESSTFTASRKMILLR